ncbi:MAG: hypothetical protein ABI699_14010 [Caldimonas sp.]
MNRDFVLRSAWKALRIAAVAALAVGVLGWVVMSLWNWLAPATFGGHMIGFWQAVGLFVLARLLVGGWRGRGHGRGHWRHRMSERWSRMSEEERERFRQGWERCPGRRSEGERGVPV